MRPFDQRILKRPRSSLNMGRQATDEPAHSHVAGGGHEQHQQGQNLVDEKRARASGNEVRDGPARQALGNGESVGNSQSQSSAESQNTKEQRRLRKGKFRCVPD